MRPSTPWGSPTLCSRKRATCEPARRGRPPPGPCSSRRKQAASAAGAMRQHLRTHTDCPIRTHARSRGRRRPPLPVRSGEWESVCNISGWQGMPHLRVRPKAMSAHGRQNVQDASGQRCGWLAGWLAGGGTGTPLWGSAGAPAGLCRSCPTRDPGPATAPRRTLFNIGKESKIGAEGISIRSNLAVRRGDGKDVAYRWVGVGAGRGACVGVLGLGLARVAACGWRGTRRERSTRGGVHGAAFCGNGHSARGCLPAPAQGPARPDGEDAAGRRRAERRAGVLRVQEHQGPNARLVSPPPK